MSNPALEILEQQRQLVAELRARLAQAETQLEGMEKIFQAMPARRRSPSTPRDVGVSVSGGRQPGAISMRWRTILGGFYASGKPFSPQDVADVVQRLEERQMKPSEARRILDGYVTYDYVTVDPFGLFTVTDLAAEKFDFTRAAPPAPPAPTALIPSTVPAAPVVIPPLPPVMPAQVFAAVPPAPTWPPATAGRPWTPPAPGGTAPPAPPTYVGHRSPFDKGGD